MLGPAIAEHQRNRQKDEQTGIYRTSEGEPVWVSVRAGSSDSVFTEIEGDVREGEEVIVSGFEEKMVSSDRARNLRRGFWFIGRKK